MYTLLKFLISNVSTWQIKEIEEAERKERQNKKKAHNKIRIRNV